MRRDAFQAIADPTRREILGLVAGSALNINAVAGNFTVSRTAVYKHIKILTECGLVVIKQQGRERYCEARMEKLHEISDWMAQYSKYWNAKLDALEIYLHKLQAAKKKTAVKKIKTKTRPLPAKKKNSKQRVKKRTVLK